MLFRYAGLGPRISHILFLFFSIKSKRTARLKKPGKAASYCDSFQLLITELLIPRPWIHHPGSKVGPLLLAYVFSFNSWTGNKQQQKSAGDWFSLQVCSMNIGALGVELRAIMFLNYLPLHINISSVSRAQYKFPLISLHPSFYCIPGIELNEGCFSGELDPGHRVPFVWRDAYFPTRDKSFISKDGSSKRFQLVPWRALTRIHLNTFWLWPRSSLLWLRIG